MTRIEMYHAPIHGLPPNAQSPAVPETDPASAQQSEAEAERDAGQLGGAQDAARRGERTQFGRERRGRHERAPGGQKCAK